MTESTHNHSESVTTSPVRNEGSQSSLKPAGEPRTSKWRSVGGIAITIAVILFARYLVSNPGESSQSQVDTLLTSETVKEYVAAEHGFRVSFPGFPLKESELIDLEGYSIPFVTYSRESADGDQAYLAGVWDFQSLPLGPAGPDLEGGLNGMAQNVDGQIRSVSPSTLGNRDGLEGVVTASFEGTHYEIYARLTPREKQIFGVMTMGIPYPRFEQFANSFQFDR